MITKASIQNFKGLSSCDLKDLARINLLIGKNGSGKSTIMEALHLLNGSLSRGIQPLELLTRRTNVFSSGRELWFRYDLESEIVIAFEIIGLSLQLRVKYDRNTNQTFSFLEYVESKTKEIKQVWSGTSSGLDFEINISYGSTALLPLSQKSKTYLRDFAQNVNFIDCTAKTKTNIIEQNLAKIKIKGEDDKFGAILNEIYGKGKQWEFVPHADRPSESRLALREAGKLTYIGDFGDGFRFSVGILGTLSTLKNTVVFIEEIESHQHPSAISKLIKHLVKIARTNNLQIFLSTHNKDVWESLARGVYVEDADKEKEEFRCLLIQRDIETGKVTVENTNDLQKIDAALG